MIPLIIRVWCECGTGWAASTVPITPHTTCMDVIECCREPGDEKCCLLSVDPKHGVHLLNPDDRPLEVAASLTKDAQFVLKYLGDEAVGGDDKRDGMKEQGSPEELLGEGVELTLGELRAMALRQQQQIDTQHQLLAAKEQRLRYLKQQEARQHQVALEGERLRRLRERVEAQELKLRKLRALRGHVDRNKQINITLTSDLESIRALFNEKEKELSLAVAKVEELTRQLEELRRGRGAAPAPPAAALELEKLRRELMYRNKLNEQQNGRLSAQRCALGARQEEMRSIDRRVSELQARLLRKRALNRQLAAVHRQQGQRINSHSNNTLSGYTSNNNNATNIQNKNDQHQVQQRGNVAAVEPYNHIPHAQSVNSKQNYQSLKQNIVQTNVPLKHNQNEIQTHLQQHDAHYMQQKSLYNGYIQQTNQENYLAQYNAKINENYNHVQQGIGSYQQHDQKMIEHINKYIDGSKQYSPNIATNGQMNKEVKINEQEFPPEFAASKSDPKYQTLPYNTKFTTKPKTSPEMRNDENKNQMIPPNVNHMTVHSTPLSVINKSLATPLNQEQNSHQNDQSNQEGKENCSKMGVDSKVSKLQSNKSISATSSSSNASSFAKPISSVAPTSNHNGSKTSAVYQTSSTKIQPVQPQTINVSAQKTNKTNLNVTQNPQIIRNTASGLSTTVSTNSPSSNSIVMSPPQNASTPLSTPDVSVAEKPKPALPPKPYVKTPPRQSVDSQNDSNQTDMNDVETQHQQLPVVREPSEMIIKPKPLNFRKAPLSEQPKLRNVANKNGVSVSLNRRIEMPPAFLFPEMDHLAKDPSENSLKEQNKSERKSNSRDELDKVASPNDNLVDDECRNLQVSQIVDQINAIEVNGKSDVIRRTKKGNLKQDGKPPLTRRVSFDPLALLLDASLEGELELVKMTATKVPNPSAANDEGITALHNAICAGHFEIVKFLVEFGCDVNAQDSDGWTPLHCAASCNNLNMVRFLLDNGACIFATTLSDHETAAEKCEEDEEGFDGCSEYLYSVQEKLGIMNGGAVYAVFSYTANRNDELSFNEGERLTVLRKGDDNEREWWWARSQNGSEGYVPRNLLGLYPRVTPKQVERAVD